VSFLSRPARRPIVVELRFGSDLSVEAVEGVLTAISGISRRSTLTFETVADEDGIRHLVQADQAVVDTLRLQLVGLIPSATLAPITRAASSGISWKLAARIGWSRAYPLLRSDNAAHAVAGLLASMGQLGPGEHVAVRLFVRPGSPRELPQQARSQKAPGALTRMVFGSPPEGHELGQIRAKYLGPLLRTSVVVAVASPSDGRASHLLSRTVGALRVRRGARGGFNVRVLRGTRIAGALERAPGRGVLLSPGELAALTGWPIDAPPVPGLLLGTSPLRHPDRRIPTSGKVIARSTWPGARGRLLAQPVEGALSHALLVGASGVGKSELAARLALADVEAGRGVFVLDGKGDLAGRDLLERIPAHRLDDVIVVDPAAGGPVPGLRVFGRGTDPELAADVVLGVLRDLYRDNWGIRSEQWLRAGLVTICTDPDGSLGDFRFLFTDDSYRRALVGKLRDPMLAATWATYEAMSPGERANQLGPALSKTHDLLGRRVVRTILSQPKPTLDLHDALATNKIVVASLSPGTLGGPAARLLGALLLHALFSAIQARITIPPGKRTPYFVFVDEPQVFADMRIPLDAMLELARGLGVGLTISAQSLSMLPSEARQAALTNSRTLVAFQQQSADDAELLAKQLSGITSEQLQSLGQFEVVARIGLGPGATAAPATGRTLPLPPPTGDPAAVRTRSGQLYGRDPDEVDRTLAQRHGHDPTGATSPGTPTPGESIGRARRKR
jgi:hypothetical protein